MGIILELLGLAVTGAFAYAALKRAGVDLGWLNPFTFMHRLKWKRKLAVPPLYCLEHPIDVAAVLGMAILQHTGVVTHEQKQGLIALFGKHLKADGKDADHLWIASSHLLKGRPIEPGEVPGIFSRTADKFSTFHAESLLALMADAAALEPSRNARQQALIEAVRQFLLKQRPDPNSWSTT